nr:unnamed protein product [Callosobruchus chinensis]
MECKGSTDTTEGLSEEIEPTTPGENDLSVTRPSLGSDAEFDDELAIPESIKLVDMGDGPVAIENSDVELECDDQLEGLPYSTINNCKKFKSYHRNVFISGIDITATITNYERNLATHVLNPNLYTIALTHGPFHWKIKKRYKQFQSLHQQLVLFRTSLNIPFPSKTHKNKRKTFRQNAPVSPKGKRKSALPRFPKKPEVLVTYGKLENRLKQLENYLNNLLSITIYRNHPATIEFLEVSHLSFISGLGFKGKEGLVRKKTGSTHPGQSGCNCFGLYHCFCCVRCQQLCNDMICSRWVKRWLFIKDTFFGYINPENGQLKSVILYDQGFEVVTGMYSIGLQTGFHLQTQSRQISVKCYTRRKGKEWTQALKEVAGTTAREFTQMNPNRSFAPIRNNVTASWFVDGASYMSAIADAIDKAKEEVFITDWWLSPEIYLKRPAIVGEYWQLKNLLKRKADSGVKIYILLYKEVEMALGLNSYYSKQKLVEASENIKVLRHPDHAKAGIFLWAHHEKMVVVDQTYAFVGGIDLCYGRWDDDKHRLTDLGSISPTIDVSTVKKRSSKQIVDTLDGQAKLWIGKDYVNFIVKDFTNLESPFDDFIDRVTTPRMPWHDVGMCVQGTAARDVARHFIQRWNATKLEKAKKNSQYPYLMPKSYSDFKSLPLFFPNMTHKVTCQVLRSVSCWSAGFLEPDTVEQSIHEAYIETIMRAQHYIYIENQFFISLPYHNPNTRNQIAEALYKRIITAHKSKQVFRVYVVMPLLPGFEGEVGGASGTSLHAITHWNYLSISQGKDAILNRLKEAGIEDPTQYISFYGLRTHSVLNGEPITELIYVHSKLMIVDDKTVICGSANINDRSLIGKRDSEIAVIIEDEAFEDGIMNGSAFPCGQFSGSLRKYLFKEHLGVLGKENELFDFDVTDPISDHFYHEIWRKSASLNTEFYEKVFHCLPTDSVQTFADLKKNHEEKPLWISEYSRAQKMLESIQVRPSV